MKVERNVLVVANKDGLRREIEQVIRRGNDANWQYYAVGKKLSWLGHFADSPASAKNILLGGIRFDLVVIERDLAANGDFQGFDLYVEVRDSDVCNLTVLLGCSDNEEPEWLENEPTSAVIKGRKETVVEQLRRILTAAFAVPKTASQPSRRSPSLPEAVV